MRRTIVALLAAASLRCGGEPEVVQRPGTRPNVVLILAEDLDEASLAALNGVTARIAKAGTTYSSYFVSSARPSSSRASALRGQYLHEHPSIATLEASTLATWLQGAGYRTALVGEPLDERLALAD